jgi:hypothetical protein
MWRPPRNDRQSDRGWFWSIRSVRIARKPPRRPYTAAGSAQGLRVPSRGRVVLPGCRPPSPCSDRSGSRRPMARSLVVVVPVALPARPVACTTVDTTSGLKANGPPQRWRNAASASALDGGRRGTACSPSHDAGERPWSMRPFPGTALPLAQGRRGDEWPLGTDEGAPQAGRAAHGGHPSTNGWQATRATGSAQCGKRRDLRPCAYRPLVEHPTARVSDDAYHERCHSNEDQHDADDLQDSVALSLP